jgi:hypothetical protein
LPLCRDATCGTRSRTTPPRVPDMFTMNRGSSLTLMSVALPCWDCRRQTNPGAASAIRFTRSSAFMNSATRGSSVGYSNVPTFI